MKTTFNLSEKLVLEEAIKAFKDKTKTEWIHKFDIKEFIKKLKYDANQNRTISAAREEDCVLIETLNLIIDGLAGDKLI